MSGAIPIENIYYLLCYAWDRLVEADIASVASSSDMRLPDLFARLLRGDVAHLIKRGVDQRYEPDRDEIAGIRGRLDFANSLKQDSFSRAKTWCEFDELSPDTLPNRIIKTTLRELAQVSELDPRLARDLRELHRRLPGVSDIRVTGSLFRRVMLGSNTASYRHLLDVCELVYRNRIVDEQSGEVRFRDFTRDDREMARLFERFLYRFFKREQRQYRVSAPRFRWEAYGEAADLARLPEMRTDVVLHNRTRVLVIDAKYYAQMLTGQFDKQTVRSSHMYQLFAYMQHLQRRRGCPPVAGLLLYPRTTRSESIRATVLGHRFEAVTLNLAQPWHDVRTELLDMAGISEERRVA